MSEHKLTAKLRKLFGRKVKALRAGGIIPGNVFGKKTKSLAVQLDAKELKKTIQEAGETSLIALSVEGESKSRPVLVSGYAQDPVSGALLHVDLHQVDLTVKTTASVPVEVIGKAPAAETGNILVVLKQEIEVEALPADLPDNLAVDVSSLKEVGDSILAKDLKVDRTKLTLQIEAEEPIVTIQEPAKEEEPLAPAEGQGETKGEEGESKEGEASAASKPTDSSSQEKPANEK